MYDVRGDILWPPHGTTPAAVAFNRVVDTKKLLLSKWDQIC